MPSKKVLSILIVIIALVAAVIITFGRDKSSTAINFASNLVAGEKVSIPENPNWQNELGGISASTTVAQTGEAGEATSTTDIISQSLISNYLALKQSGTLDSTSAQNLVDQTANYINQANNQVVQVTQKYLNIVADNGKQSITDYGENLGNILRNNKPKVVVDERQIITAAVSSKDQSKIDELDGVIAVYEKIVNDLIKMLVPKTFVKAHLDMINGTRGMIISLIEIKTIFSDPVKSLQAIQLYKDGATVSTQAMNATIVFIKKSGIIYEQGSGGYYLLHGI
jgi:hypothetical protein